MKCNCRQNPSPDETIEEAIQFIRAGYVSPDELIKKLFQNLSSDQISDSYQNYIRTLDEQNPSRPLDTMLRQLLVTFVDFEGAHEYVYATTIDLLRLLTPPWKIIDPVDIFVRSINATDNRWYFRGGNAASLDDFIKDSKLYCPCICGELHNPCELLGCLCTGCIDPLTCECWACSESGIRQFAKLSDSDWGICTHHHLLLQAGRLTFNWKV
jgi:hypothetical protein